MIEDKAVQVHEGTAVTSYIGDSLYHVLEVAVLDNDENLSWANLDIDKKQRNRVTGKHPWVLQVMK